MSAAAIALALMMTPAITRRTRPVMSTSTAMAKMTIAAERAGVNSNVLTDEDEMDPLSGTSVLNGIPVRIEAVIHS
jgi:hypothetical protein